MNYPAVLLTQLATVQALMASTPAPRRRSSMAGVTAIIRAIIDGVQRGFRWYVEHFLDFAPLMDVLGHTSASASMHGATMRPNAGAPIDLNQGEGHD